MKTLSMQGVAELAQVERPVVSMWRSRFASSDCPFPAPLQNNPLRFDADEVSKWLQETSHGNNADAVAESSLYSSVLDSLTRNLDGASALLLLQAVRGEPLTAVDPADIALTVDVHELGPVLDAATALHALEDSNLLQSVDELAEAAFNGTRVLTRLVDAFVASGGYWASEALTSAGVDLMGAVIAEIQRADPRLIVPVGPGGLILANAVANQSSEQDLWTFGYQRSMLEYPYNRVAWRRLAALGFSVSSIDNPGNPAGSTDGVLYMLQWQAVENEAHFYDCVENLVLRLSDKDALVVVGPSRLMSDQHGDRRRRQLLATPDSYTAPLRYVARLPKGLSKFGGRRRLALWVFGRRTSTWTVVGSHSDSRTDAAACESIAADAAAAISTADDVRAHAFKSSTVLATNRFVRQSMLTGPAVTASPVDGGERLARIWELDRGLLDGIDVIATPPRPAQISIVEACRELGRDLPGARIPKDHIGTPQTGWVQIIGPEELRDEKLLGRRGIDRLTLVRVAPRAKFTRPGDVIYVAAGPHAITDHNGGHLVEAPARIFRCLDAESEDRQLVPAVVAADIAMQPGPDRCSWQLRTVPVDRAGVMAEIIERGERRRRHLLRELRDLDALESELANGLAAGSLAATISTSKTMKDG